MNDNPSHSQKHWIVAALVGIVALACLCPLPLIGIGGFVLWLKQDVPPVMAKEKADAQKFEDELAKFEKAAKKAPPDVDGRITFLPNSKITAPRLGSLRNHPWWTKPMTDADVDKIIAAISQLPVQRKMLLLGSNGTFSTFDDTPPTSHGEVCAVLHENDAIFFFAAQHIPTLLPTSRAATISMLSQGLDAGHLSSELARKTGKGFSVWDQFTEMGKVDGLKNVVPLPPAPGGALKAPGAKLKKKVGG